jgi:hypothetical protein
MSQISHLCVWLSGVERGCATVWELKADVHLHMCCCALF